MSPSPLIVGILVGGRARRLGGIAKGLLPVAGGDTVVGRLLAITREALPEAPVVLVGDASKYGSLGLPAVADSPSGIGPLGGLRGLLAHADDLGLGHALALACDMPLISTALVRRLAEEASGRALALAPREPRGGPWYALSARYAVGAIPALDAMLAGNERALQRLFARLGSDAVELPLEQGELALLADWDSPEDLP